MGSDDDPDSTSASSAVGSELTAIFSNSFFFLAVRSWRAFGDSLFGSEGKEELK